MQKLNKWILRIAVSSGVLTVAGGAIYGIYHYSKEQGTNYYVFPKYTKISQFFSKETEKAQIKERYIAGKKGYIVNKGPIRITTAYHALFSKKSLLQLADWVYKNVAWGANALSLRNINFTTGIDKKEQKTTKGFHTSGRDGSSIYISPDAFEDINKIGDKLFHKFYSQLIASFRVPFTQKVQQEASSTSFVPTIPSDLSQFLNSYINGTTISGLGVGSYQSIDQDKASAIFEKMLDESANDNFVASIKSPTFKTIAQTTALGNLYFSNPERIAYLEQNQKMDQALEKDKTRIAFITAYKMLTKATGGTNGIGNTFLSLALANIIFEPGKALDRNGNPILYSLRSRSEWDNYAGMTNRLSWNNVEPALLNPHIGMGYFTRLYRDGVSASSINIRAAIYQLFLQLYDHVLSYLNATDSSYKIIQQMWKSPLFQASNIWINEVRNLAAQERSQWILTAKLPFAIKFNVLLDDEWMLNAHDRDFIASLDEQAVLRRSLDIDVSNFYKQSLNVVSPFLANLSIADAYRQRLMDAMKYTISHEYGHHETLWSTYGIYGPQTGNGTFKDTINLYSEILAAKSVEHAHRQVFTSLWDIAYNKTHPQQGLKNALDILMRSNDKFSSSFTPGFINHRYYGYLPPHNGRTGFWRSSFEDFTQAQINFTTNASGAPIVRLGATQTVGQVPIILNTTGVDSNNSRTNQSSYLYTINKANLSQNNPVKAPQKGFDKFLRTFLTPAELLYGYQTSLWILKGHKNGDSWSQKQQISLPEFDATGLQNPTTEFAPILVQDPFDRTSKMMTFKGVLRLRFLMDDKYIHEVIGAIDKEIAKLYNYLIVKYPNLFEDVGAQKKLSSYRRSQIIFQEIITMTKDAIADAAGSDPYDALINKEQVFYDPKDITFQNINASKTARELFDASQNSELVKHGTVVLGSAQSDFADYTGNLPEFMTRIVNQLQFRPEYKKFYDATGKMDTLKLQSTNDGWYDDLNRFAGLGLHLYNIGVGGSDLTRLGAMMVNWYRTILGLHVADITAIPMTPEGTVDYQAFDKMVVRASPLTKIFKNSKTGLMTMWGWIPAAKANDYKRIVLRNKQDGHEIVIPIIASEQKTSNYFYYETMDNSPTQKHIVNQGFVQWVAKWQVAGDYVNANLKPGSYELYFLDQNNQKISPFQSQDSSQIKAYKHYNNDYGNLFAEVVFQVIPSTRKIEIRIK